jgi:hypothetical protein
MDLTEAFGADLLRRRTAFLLSRAQVHEQDERNPIRSAGVAATLYQEAAAVHLIGGKIEEAKHALWRGGSLLVKLGIPHGEVLLALARWAGDESSFGEDEDSLTRMVRVAVSRSERRHPDSPADAGTPLLAAALAQPSQSVALLQAIFLRSEDSFDAMEWARPLRKRLALHKTALFGRSGISVGDYVALCEWLAHSPILASSETPRETLYLYAGRRSESLRAARADQHHWRRLLGAAQLVDFNAVVLFILALRSGVSTEAIFLDEPWIADAFAFPAKAAEALARDGRGIQFRG